MHCALHPSLPIYLVPTPRILPHLQERDIAGLEPLTCKAVRDAFEGTWEQYDKQNVSMKFEASAECRSCDLLGYNAEVGSVTSRLNIVPTAAQVQAVSQATILGGGMVSDETLGASVARRHSSHTGAWPEPLADMRPNPGYPPFTQGRRT